MSVIAGGGKIAAEQYAAYLESIRQKCSDRNCARGASEQPRHQNDSTSTKANNNVVKLIVTIVKDPEAADSSSCHSGVPVLAAAPHPSASTMCARDEVEERVCDVASDLDLAGARGGANTTRPTKEGGQSKNVGPVQPCYFARPRVFFPVMMVDYEKTMMADAKDTTAMTKDGLCVPSSSVYVVLAPANAPKIDCKRWYVNNAPQQNVYGATSNAASYQTYGAFKPPADPLGFGLFG